MHPRQGIVNYLIERLKAAGTQAGERVYSRPKAHWSDEDLNTPMILLLPLEEGATDTQELGEEPRSMMREMTLLAAGMARGGDDLTSTLEDLAWSLEQTIRADPGLGERALDTALTLTEFDYEDMGESLVGAVLLRFQITYLA